MPAPLNYRNHSFVTDPGEMASPLTGDGDPTLWLGWLSFVGATLLFALVATALCRRWRHAPTSAAPETPSARLWVTLSLALLALAARLVGLDQEPADSQELTYYLQVAIPRSFGATDWKTALGVALSPQMVSPHPPLYRLLLFFWCELGDSLTWLRALSVIAGAATVPVLHRWLVRELGRLPGLVGAAALALSPFHVYWSQNATPYALLGLQVVAMMALHADALRSGGRRLWLYGLCVASGLLTHFLFPAFLGAMVLEVAWRWWRSDRAAADHRRLWRFAAAGGWAALPFAGFAIGLVFYGLRMPVVMPMLAAMELFPTHSGPAEALPDFLGGVITFLGHGVASTFGDPRWLPLALPGTALAAWGLWRGARTLRWTVAAPLALFGLFFLTLGVLTVAGGGFFYFASRRFAPAVPLLYAALAAGLAATGERGRRWALVALLVLAGSQGARLVGQALDLEKPDLPAAAAWLDGRLADGDAVAVAPYVFFDFMYTWEVRDRIPDWWQVGGAARWVPYQRPDGSVATVMVSTSDLMLPWSQTLEHGFLERVWLITVDEVPWGLRELEGPGTIGEAPLLAGGFQACPGEAYEGTRVSVRCFERGETRPTLAPTLDVGEDDYRQAIALSPPGQVRSPNRRLGHRSGFVVPHPGPGGAIVLSLKARRLHLPDGVRVTAEAAGQAIDSTIELGRGSSRYEVDVSKLEAAPGEPVTVWLEPTFDERRHRHCFTFIRGSLGPLPALCGVFVDEVSATRQGR